MGLQTTLNNWLGSISKTTNNNAFPSASNNRNGVTATATPVTKTTYTPTNVQTYAKSLSSGVSNNSSSKTDTTKSLWSQGLATGINGPSTSLINAQDNATIIKDQYNKYFNDDYKYTGSTASLNTLNAYQDATKDVREAESNANNYYSNNGSSSLTSNTAYYNELINQLMSNSEEAREQALEAIMQNLGALKSTYGSQIQQVIDEYDSLINQNEVKKDRARRVVKENQANRGQLDSGLGRQEQLDLNIGYDNETLALQAAKTQAVNEIYNLIAQAEAEANTNRANVNNTYNNALLEYQAQLANQ